MSDKRARASMMTFWGFSFFFLLRDYCFVPVPCKYYHETLRSQLQKWFLHIAGG